MGLQWQTRILKDEESVNFDFGNPVAAYAVGVSYFNIIFPLGGNNNYTLKNLGFGLTGSQPGPNVINVQASLTFDSGSGTLFDTTESSVYVTVIAWVGNSADGIFLGISPNLTPGQQPVSTDGVQPVYSGSFINSIFTNFTSGQNVREIAAKVNCTAPGEELLVDGNAEITNGSGDLSSAQKVVAGLFASLTPTLNVETLPLSFNDPSGSAVETVTFSSSVKATIALLTSFDFVFNNATNITGLYAGLSIKNPPFDDPTGPLVPQLSIDPDNPKNVIVNYIGTMFDYANNTVCGSNNVTLLVIAVTE